jgi:hypothetical protein
MYRQVGVGEPVVREFPFSRGLDEAGSTQVPKVPRDGGLRKPQELDQVADAEFAGGEEIEDPDPGRVGEPTEEKIEVCDRIGDLRRHAGARIRVCGYNLAKRM